jgi:hypothetical protein
MNILNKGRCSRCGVHEARYFDEFGKRWLYCHKYKKWARGAAGPCKESPCGVPPESIKGIMDASLASESKKELNYIKGTM